MSYLDSCPDRGKILDAISGLSERDGFIAQLLIAGIGIKQITLLKPHHVSLSCLELKVPGQSGKRARKLSLALDVIEGLRGIAAKRKLYLFGTKQLPQITVRTIYRIIGKLSKISGIEITPNLLVHGENPPKAEFRDKQKTSKNIVKDREVFSQLQKHKKRSCVSHRDTVLIQLLHELGCPLSLIRDISISNLDFKNNQIIANYKGKVSAFPISDYLKELISDFANLNKLDIDSYLFETRQHSTLSTVRIFQIVKDSFGRNGKTNVRCLQNNARRNAQPHYRYARTAFENNSDKNLMRMAQHGI